MRNVDLGVADFTEKMGGKLGKKQQYDLAGQESNVDGENAGQQNGDVEVKGVKKTDDQPVVETPTQDTSKPEEVNYDKAQALIKHTSF